MQGGVKEEGMAQHPVLDPGGGVGGGGVLLGPGLRGRRVLTVSQAGCSSGMMGLSSCWDGFLSLPLLQHGSSLALLTGKDRGWRDQINRRGPL